MTAFAEDDLEAVLDALPQDGLPMGLSELNGYSKGDLLVHVLVWTPQKLNAEQTAFFENCQEDQNFKPNPNLKEKSTFDRIRDMFS